MLPYPTFYPFCCRPDHSLSLFSAGADADGAFLAGYSAGKEIKEDFVFVLLLCGCVHVFCPDVSWTCNILVWFGWSRCVAASYVAIVCWFPCGSNQVSKESSSIPKAGTASNFALSSEDLIPNDFVGLGVAVAVKNPVSICVVVVTVTLPVVWDCEDDVEDEVAELQSLTSSYKIPLMITPSPSTICCF